MTDNALLLSLLEQEDRLVFPFFDYVTAWQLGTTLYDSARQQGLPVAITIRRGSQRLFHAALLGSSANNDAWLERKCAVVEHFGHSSYCVGCLSRAEEDSDFNVVHRLDPVRYAAHGGAFPILLDKTGYVGVVGVSGLAQEDDHRFVVEQLETFLGASRT
ncbi:MAG: heme-degrading domain-containing protein [Acidimicrobiales bacterium]